MNHVIKNAIIEACEALGYSEKVVNIRRVGGTLYAVTLDDGTVIGIFDKLMNRFVKGVKNNAEN